MDSRTETRRRSQYDGMHRAGRGGASQEQQASKQASHELQRSDGRSMSRTGSKCTPCIYKASRGNAMAFQSKTTPPATATATATATPTCQVMSCHVMSSVVSPQSSLALVLVDREPPLFTLPLCRPSSLIRPLIPLPSLESELWEGDI